MDQETYNQHLNRLKSGAMVTLGGRTALNAEHLDFAIRAGGDTVPGDEEPQDENRPQADEAEDVNGDGTIDELERANFAALKAIGEALGVAVKNGDSKADAIAAIRKAQADRNDQNGQ